MGSSPKPAQQQNLTPGTLTGTVSNPAQTPVQATPRHPQYTPPFMASPIGIDEPPVQEPPQMMLENANPGMAFNPNSVNPNGPADEKKQILQRMFSGGTAMRGR